MAEPQDRKSAKPTKAEQQRMDKRQREVVAEFMSSGIDFSPFTIDAGDGVEWEFTADPMPAETEKLRQGMTALDAAAKAGEGLQEAFDSLVGAIRDRMIHDKQKKEFPKPVYGQNAIMFFALHLATGRDGFPTEEA